jgi:enamine deaminase RidA (YjgF/YER057c/UK114 family)
MMPLNIKEKLHAMGLDLPEPPPPAASYIPYVIEGNTLHVSGQIPFLNGKENHIGKLGDNYSVDEGKLAARDCALNLLAQVDKALEHDWNKFSHCLKVGGFVNATPAFQDHPLVINGASEFFIDLLGQEKGQHIRYAVGASSLPFGVAVEIEGVFFLNI